MAQDSVRVEHYTRSVDNTWTLHDHQTLEEELKIASIGISLPLGPIYDRVELPPASSSPNKNRSVSIHMSSNTFSSS